ncbi:MAG: hypothetical protein JJ957_20635 [Pseudomonadales bacterium]|nr:hypothetical protein [Pseudomonadales bacterium]MBO6596502.1 hypothetical protein [Pseudomonadales bacterium]MBO6823509.1 hypothetical protein [Pseudomonadales bacterium]
MSDPQVIACFVIYRGESIEYQGTFQVLTTEKEMAVAASDGSQFKFRHSYTKAKANIEVSTSKNGSSIDLAVPINRSKVKWKQCQLEDYDVRYRCVFENIRESKELKKLRRKAAVARSTRQTDTPTIFYVGSNGGDT